jgi:hypothetical protein
MDGNPERADDAGATLHTIIGQKEFSWIME